MDIITGHRILDKDGGISCVFLIRLVCLDGTW